IQKRLRMSRTMACMSMPVPWPISCAMSSAIGIAGASRTGFSGFTAGGAGWGGGVAGGGGRRPPPPWEAPPSRFFFFDSPVVAVPLSPGAPAPAGNLGSHPPNPGHPADLFLDALVVEHGQHSADIESSGSHARLLLRRSVGNISRNYDGTKPAVIEAVGCGS